jgi:Carboxypeptidase regulatory-like domain
MNCKISSLLRCCIFLLVLVALLFSIRPGRAQEVTARLAGTVNDTAGALVPEAALTARNVSTGVVTTAASDPSGNYVFPSLAPGTYTVSVEKQGSPLE